MTGRKITLKNIGSTIGLFTYQTLSTSIWQYQVEILPGQTKIIFCVDGTFSYDPNQHDITIIESIPFPPDFSTTTTTTSPIPNENKTLIQVSTISNTNTNWEYSILNYGQNSILGPVDLGLDSNDWNFDNYSTTINGWLLVFSHNNYKNIKFIDKNGYIIYTYTASTLAWDYDTLGNQYAYYTDYVNLKCIFTDFTNVTVYDIPSNYDYFGFDYNYDDSNSVGGVFKQVIGNYSTYLLFKPTGYSILYNWDNTSYGVDSVIYYKSNYFVIFVYNLTNDQYSFFNVYDSNGVLIKSENLTSNNPTSISGVTHTPTTTNPLDFNGYVTGGVTNGNGSGATFYVVISSGTVTQCSPIAKGNGYQINNTITFDGTVFGGTSGVDNIIMTVTSLGNFEYTNYDFNAFGEGKINIIMWGDDNSIPYLIYVYDGPNNQLYTTNHDRNVGNYGYYDWITYYTDIYNESLSSQSGEDIHIQFNDDDGSYNGYLWSVDYCNIVSWYNSNNSFEVYNFAVNANYDYYISRYNYYVGESLILLSNRDDNFINYEVFQQGQHQTIQVVQTNSLDGWYFNDYWSGEKFMTTFNLNGNSEYLYFIHNYDGTYIDDLYINAQNTGYNSDTQYNSMVLINYHLNKTYYWNSSVNNIVTLDEYYDNWNTENSYYTTLNQNHGNFVIFNTDTQQARILTKDSISPIISLTNSDDGYNVRIGKDLMAYLYVDTSSYVIVVKVYNLSGRLLTTVRTNETDSINFTIEENRVYLKTYTGGNNVHYLITSYGYKKVTTSDASSTFVPNDWNF